MLAAASHLSNTLDFRKPSDVAFTATLNSGEHPNRRSTHPEVWCTSTWQLNRTLSWAGVGIVNARKMLISCHYILPHAFVVFTANMLQNVYRNGREALFFSFPPLQLCCRLPDCWSIKIIVMEIDLIDNVPCSHCEQLVPCEHNPEMSSKNFPSQTFNPSSSFALLSKRWEKPLPGKTKDKILSVKHWRNRYRIGKYSLGSRFTKEWWKKEECGGVWRTEAAQG